ncbi:hypothetical protein IFM89_006215 [Coptis chinensis]|uniref:Uncharacterized protein n=1 Tax=Coptis chinensis TaxID=261450 RepID=A0A835HAX2_9MAGN|nr:hypothetical protein IFM89_006215 [Coptis chinensis]
MCTTLRSKNTSLLASSKNVLKTMLKTNDKCV